MIRALIVDDEPVARSGIWSLLEEDPDIEVVGECADGRQAVESILRERPDLVFLDVQMPGLDGFGVLEELGAEETPVVVFVTAYDEYAIRAFEVNALDYLLKPFDRERFVRTLRRAKRAVEQERLGEMGEKIRSLLGYVRADDAAAAWRGESDRVVLRDEGRVKILRSDEIAWIEADGNYVRIHADETVHLTRSSLTAFLERLDPGRFLRVSRSAAVNVDRVRELHSRPNGQYEIVLRNDSRLVASRRYRKRVEAAFGEG